MDPEPAARRALVDTPWPGIPGDLTVLIPVGSTEQHGPHLPFDVDTVIARAVCAEAARLRGADMRVAPAVAYGASGEHQDFPGTVSIGTEVLTSTLVELGRSARLWAGRLVFVNGHGGNIDALERALTLLRAEGTDAAWLPCRHGEGHAGRAETSLMLHLDPARVELDRAAPGRTEPMQDLLPRLRAEGVRAVAPNGVLGDPTGASAAEGEALLQRMADEVVSALGAR
jgi:creatinine amidohydrolase